MRFFPDNGRPWPVTLSGDPCGGGQDFSIGQRGQSPDCHKTPRNALWHLQRVGSVHSRNGAADGRIRIHGIFIHDSRFIRVSVTYGTKGRRYIIGVDHLMIDGEKYEFNLIGDL